MLIETLLAVIILWDASFFVRYVLSLRKKYSSRNWSPMVSVVIPAYNEEENIEDAVKAALSQDYPNFEVIVVDDGSTDGTYEKALSIKDERLRVIRINHGGKTRALNVGLEFSAGEIIVTTDADGLLEKNAVSRLVERFYSDDIAVVGGQVRVRGETFLELAQDIEHLRIATFRRAKELENLSLAPGPISAFRKRSLLKIGGFVNDLVEDYATTLALKKIGRAVYAPGARVWVRMPSGLGALWRQRRRWFLGDLPKLSSKPFKEKLVFIMSDLVALLDVLFPLAALMAGKWSLLLIFLVLEWLMMYLIVRVEGGMLVEVALFPVILWFWAAFYLSLHIYGLILYAFGKKTPSEWN